ncbi:WW domain binding protein VOPP1-like [Centruroides vittatus]|uniref:vesicular, overexpressed in cancer, prosurvival protein 1-like n=1 Tax=Centruroides sculpturatus TaxID=218467 RepID=UPI000C6DDCA3|nr:vesicular, overexpressed in cancer, prosurvival protein 1-like [Centruroides sculpturatus]
MMKNSFNFKIFISLLILLIKISCAFSIHCTYTYESGFDKHFYCKAYEYCCGQFCCRSREISFYQLWYFWLMIILMLLMCSGGGWWYRFRYRNHFHNQQSHFGFAGSATPTLVRPHVYGARPFQPPTSTQGPPPPYPTQGPLPPQQAFPVHHPNAIKLTPYLNTQGTAPPPYTGPPPSYDAAVGQATSNH